MSNERDALLKEAQDKFEREQLLAEAHAKFDSSQTSKLESAGRGLAQGVTLGFADEIVGGVGGAYDALTSDASFSEAYDRHRDESRANTLKAKEANPLTYGGSEIAGAIGSAVLPGMALAKGATMAKVAGQAALQGGLASAGSTEKDVFTGEGLKEVGSGALIGGVAGATFEKTLRMLPQAAELAKKAGKKAAASTFGIKEELIEHYMKNADDVNAALPLESIKNKLDDVYQGQRQATDQSISGLELANRGTDEAADAYRSARDLKSSALKDQKHSAGRAYSEAKDAVTRLPEELDSAFEGSVRDLRKHLGTKSSEAWDQLPVDGTEFALGNLKGDLTKQINSLKIGGEYITDSAKAAGENLQRMRDRLSDIKSIDPREAKRIIQQIQDEVQASYGAHFVDPATAQKKELAANLNSKLKEQFPEYAEAMKPTAEAAKLMGEFEGIRDQKSARAFVNSVFGKNGDISFKNVQKLEEMLGTPGRFSSRLDGARNTLKNADNKLTSMSAPDWMESQLKTVDRSKLDEAEALAEWKRQLADTSKRGLKDLSKISPDRTQPLIERSNPFRARTSIEDQALLKELGAREGVDFQKMIKDSAAKDAFEKGQMNGSRNTLLWGTLGGITGGLPGAGAGAAFGHQVMDRYGPKLGKVVMDGILAAQKKGIPLAEAIEASNIPTFMREDLRKLAAPMASRASQERPQLRRVAERDEEKRNPAADPVMTDQEAQKRFIEGNR